MLADFTATVTGKKSFSGSYGEFLQMRQDRLRGMEADVDRVAVRRRLRGEFGADHPASAGTVLDHGGLAVFADLLRQGAARDVGDATGGERDNDPDRLRRICLCLRDA